MFHRRIAIVLLGLVIGCQKRETVSTAMPVSSTAPVTVTLVSPKKVNLNWTIEQPGSLMAFETTPIVAKLPGYVSKVHVDIGDLVQSGQLLASIDIPELLKEAEQKKAMVEVAAAERIQAERNLEVSKAQQVATEAVVREMKAGQLRAQADFDRWASETRRVDGLAERGVVDAQTAEETRRQFRSAAASREEAAAKVISAEQKVLESRAMVGRAEADVTASGARKNLAQADADRVAALVGYTQVRSPYAGVVIARHIHTGHFLQPSANSRLDPLLTVAHLDVVRTFVEVPEAVVDKCQPGATVNVRVPALAGREYPGTITRTTSVINPESRTLRVEIDLKNPDGKLRPGMYAVARIAASTRDAMVLPSAAVLFADETAYAFLVTDGKVSRMRVRVGRVDAGQIEVLGIKRVLGSSQDFQVLQGTEKFVSGNLGAVSEGQAVLEQPASTAETPAK